MPRLYVLLVICYFGFVIAKGGGRGGGSRGSGSRGSSYSRGGGSHTYPSSQGLSGNSASNNRASHSHSYPESSGMSGNNYKPSYTQKTEVHNHYHYSPPQHISYGSQQHPVFVGSPPSYVYVYKDSGSRFNNLLTGLALYNLGRASNSHGYHTHHGEYTSPAGEICKLGISKSNGEYEETRINCRLMSSFIWDAERENKQSVSNRIVTNVTQIINNGNSTVIFQNTTVVDALEDKGPSIQVRPGMKCFMIRIARDSSMLKRHVDCGLLQEYAAKSMRYESNSARCTLVVPVVSIMASVLLNHQG